MAPRSRTHIRTESQGIWRRFGDTSGGGTRVRESEMCQDHTGSGDCNSFWVSRWESTGGVIHQNVDPGFWGAYFQNYISDGAANEANFPHLGFPVGEVPTSAESALRAINRTSPSRPYVDVPANLLQLGELIGLLRDVGYHYLRRIGTTNLKFQFGVAPLVGDIVKLTRFNEQVDFRVKELMKLRSAKGFRKTVDIGFYEKKAQNNVFFQTAGAFSQLPVETHTRLGIRAHCRWLPSDVSGLATPKSIRALARRAVSGATIDFATLWEIMPWSWFIDWGVNIGSYLYAQRNTVPATLSSCVVMEHTKSDARAPEVTLEASYGRIQSSFHMAREDKRRFVPIVSPSAHFPFLSGNKMGIVASLAVARARF